MDRSLPAPALPRTFSIRAQGTRGEAELSLKVTTKDATRPCPRVPARRAGAGAAGRLPTWGGASAQQRIFTFFVKLCWLGLYLRGTFRRPSGTGPDSASTFIYKLINADARFSIVGNQLKVANGLLLDYEQAAFHNINVRVTDATGLTFDKVLKITVADVAAENVTGDATANTFVAGAGNDILVSLQRASAAPAWR